MVAAILLALAQDAVEQQIDAYLRQFQAATELQQSLAVLSSQLTALGAAATNPIARRLAEDLRDGMASASVPALIDALSGRPEGLAPLQTAFRDAATSIAGRLELAAALAQLDDTMSWREGIRSVAVDAKATLDDRLRALALLLGVEDPRALDEVRAIVKGLGGLRASDRRHVVQFLARANTPETRSMLGTILEDEGLPRDARLAAGDALLELKDASRAEAARRVLAELRPGLSVEEPRVSIAEKPWRPPPASGVPPPHEEKKGAPDAPLNYKMALVVAAAGVAALLLTLRRRN